MKKLIQLIFVCFFLLSFSNEFAVLASDDSPANSDIDPINFLLSTEDLMQLCEWEQSPIITRQVAEGILTSSELTCGTDSSVRRVSQMVLITLKELQPGDANYFISLRDTEKEPALIDIGDWATHYHTMYDQTAIVFTKQNVLVYIANNGGYTISGQKDSDNLITLAKIVENSIPGEYIPVQIPSTNSDLILDQNYVQSISVSQPDMRFVQMENTTPAMFLNEKYTFDPIQFLATFEEPHEVVITIRSINATEPLARWILPESATHSHWLNQLYEPAPILGVDHAFQYFFQNNTYIFQASVDGNLIYQSEFNTLVQFN